MDGFSALAPQSGPTGAMSAPSPNPGAMADSLSKVGIATQILQEALPGLPMGDEIHKTVLDTITKLSKVAPPSAQVPGVQATQLSGLQKQAQQSAMLQALTRALNVPGGGGGAGGGAAPMASPASMQPPGPAPAGPMM